MKKIISVLISISFIMSLFTALPTNATNEVSEKQISTATLDDDFADDCVVVVISKEESEVNKVFSIDEFTGVSLTHIEDLTHFDEDQSDNPYFNADAFHQILKLNLAQTGKEEVLKAVRALEKLEFIIAAEPNYYYRVDNLPTDVVDAQEYEDESNYQLYTNEIEGRSYSYGENYWELSSIHTGEAWDLVSEYAVDGNEVVVGIIDSGLSYHANLEGKVNWDLCAEFNESPNNETGYDSVQDDNDSHGTSIAGIIVADGNSAVGVASKCNNVKVVGLQASDLYGERIMSLSAIDLAVKYAIANRIPILNCSFGNTVEDNAGDSIYKYAMSQYNGLLVCSAGNNMINTDQTLFEPAGYDFDNIISVAGTKSGSFELGTPAEWKNDNNGNPLGSNYGVLSVDIAAPGTDIFTTSCTDPSSYTHFSCTSAAAPFVSAVAAMVLSVQPNLDGATLKKIITDSAQKVPELADKIGNEGAFLDAAAAVQKAIDDTVKVTFDDNNGNDTYCKYYIKGETYGALPTPTRDDCEFNAWYNGSQIVTNDTIVTSGDKQFQAYWDADITYDYYDNVVTTETVTFGENYSLTPPSNMQRSGCNLYSWKYNDTEYTIQSGEKIIITGEATLEAYWSATITYDLNGGSGNEFETVYFHDYYECEFPYVNNPTRGTLRFQGWSKQEEINEQSTFYNSQNHLIVTGDITLYAGWKVTLRFNPFESQTTDDYPVQLTLGESAEYKLDDTFSQTGYKFTGWKDENGTVYKPRQTITVTAPMVFDGTWEMLYVKLRYDAKHYNSFWTQAIYYNELDENGAIPCSLLKKPSTGAYTFVGWQIVGEGSTIYVPKSTASLPGFKNYQLIDVVTNSVGGQLTYDVGEGQMENTSQILNAAPPRIITKEEPTRTGYTFLGWATTEDGEAVFAPGSGYGGAMYATLYAKWISDDFVIRYDTGTDTTDEVQAYDPPLSTVYTAPGMYSDSGIILPTVVPKRDGYTFLGWSYGDEIYEGGERFILPASVSAAPSADGGNVIKLTAAWERYPEEVLISFFDPAPYTWLEDTYYTRCVTRGGTYGNAYLPYDDTKSASFPSALDRDGKYFIGWADADGDLIGEGSKVTEDDFHMLYSAWVPHKNFTDLEYGSSASRSASICAQFGIMQGVSDSVFSPNATVTRGTAATVLYRLEGSPVYGNNVYYDVVTKTSPDDDIDREQSMAVTWITENGFAGALDANADACYFGVTENITRAQLVTVLYRYALEKGLADDSTVYPDTVLDGYTDKDQLGQWAVKPMQWAVSTGLISGTTSTTLSPNDAVTRIALATVTTRMIQRLISNGNFEHSFTPDNVNEAAEALGYVSKTLDNNSWETISAVSAAGIAKAVWNVGDEKTVTLSTGESVTVQIYGFDHDDLSDGSGKAGITFGLKDVMQNARRMHSFADNTIPLSGNEMGVWLNGDSIGDVYDSLPLSLQNSIRAADKVTSVGGSSEELRTESYKVFLFSEVECFGRTHHSVAGEGEKYAIFTDAASRVKILEGPQILEWWLRSPRKADGTSYCIVHSTGNAGYTSGSWPYAGVNFGFCI